MGTETEAVLAGGGGRLLERYRVQEPKRQVRMGGVVLGSPALQGAGHGGWGPWRGTWVPAQPTGLSGVGCSEKQKQRGAGVKGD